MPRYYFHFWETLSEDDKGEVFADAEAAHAHAKRIARELADGGESRNGRIIVTEGDSDRLLFEVPVPPTKDLN
jgi:hypothetical protein